MKYFISLLSIFLVCSAQASDITMSEMWSRMQGAQINIGPHPNVNPDAHNSEVGKLAASMLGNLYTFVEDLQYVGDKEAHLTLRIVDLRCSMIMIDGAQADQQSPVWKLAKLDCD
ncbi:hypothetical protein [Alteromonas macleodii]|uniref:Uncharacterized protein n=1 Tax=Alteromonas macleodii TaxID=28108 RepID=A0AB36FQB0_ALTMA|nr:hypothetical protein [Alteromonas macleodii]OES24484.1 hypothetical protein BFV95_4751 [Alteromonas macleodii]OES25541.1 hypothetical protein BFV94_4394 [Alteromonas macleodii]OES25842.1 hypothetical protein BFV93_4305 [Alteromonas macleodii]OES38636.1 hypothetical protein BFV96_4747 [Alteromonas macleodii]